MAVPWAHHSARSTDSGIIPRATFAIAECAISRAPACSSISTHSFHDRPVAEAIAGVLDGLVIPP